MGRNGAGKPTLINVLVGVHALDAGVIRLAGEPVPFSTPLEARTAGIQTLPCTAYPIGVTPEATRRHRHTGRVESRESADRPAGRRREARFGAAQCMIFL
jgi:simple sugar transport system ATP-binding protein